VCESDVNDRGQKCRLLGFFATEVESAVEEDATRTSDADDRRQRGSSCHEQNVTRV
jgi:hypothetical protein